MTKEEAIKLEDRCDKIMSGYLGEPSTVSLALSGKLKIEFEDGDCYMTLVKTLDSVDYVSYFGFYDNLVEKINCAIECVKDNRDIFDQLIWSYNNRSELE